MNNNSLITAMMLVKDRAGMLPGAIESVLSQCDQNFELVILDDGSSDSTWKVCQHYAKLDDRIVLLQNLRSSGIPKSRNQVLAVARGKYVAICDSDDLSRPTRFRELRAVLDSSDDIVAVGSQINLFTGDDPSEGYAPNWHWGLKDGRLPLPFASAMLRRDKVIDAGGFCEQQAVAEDLHLAYKLAARGGKFKLLEKTLLDYRHHEGSSTKRGYRRLQWHTLRAQTSGAVALKGRINPRGYLVMGQTILRMVSGRGQ